jgi:DNA-binding CsgD family transcriptional regulator
MFFMARVPPKPTGDQRPAHGRVEAVLGIHDSLVRRSKALLDGMKIQVDELKLQRALLSRQRGRSGQATFRQPDHNGLEAVYGLTQREIEVARLLADGRGNAAIASALGISPHTARHHTQHVLAKLGAHSRAEAGVRLRGLRATSPPRRP